MTQLSPVKRLMFQQRLHTQTHWQKIRWPISATLLALILLFTTAGSYGDSGASPEYKIKAAYLYNLIKFVNWPNEQQQPTDVPTLVCIYGNNPFASNLDQLTSYKAKGHQIALKFLQASDTNPQGCHMLFIAASNANPKKILAASQSLPILTVVEDSALLDRGAIVALATGLNKVQLQINLSKAKMLNFEISGNLLEIAKVVK